MTEPRTPEQTQSVMVNWCMHQSEVREIIKQRDAALRLLHERQMDHLQTQDQLRAALARSVTAGLAVLRFKEVAAARGESLSTQFNRARAAEARLAEATALLERQEPVMAELRCCDWSGDGYGPDRAQLAAVGQAFVECESATPAPAEESELEAVTRRNREWLDSSRVARIAELERELAATLKEKQRLEQEIIDAVREYNGRVDEHRRELAAANRQAVAFGAERDTAQGCNTALLATIDAAIKKFEWLPHQHPSYGVIIEYIGDALSLLREAQKAAT